MGFALCSSLQLSTVCRVGTNKAKGCLPDHPWTGESLSGKVSGGQKEMAVSIGPERALVSAHTAKAGKCLQSVPLCSTSAVRLPHTQARGKYRRRREQRSAWRSFSLESSQDEHLVLCRNTRRVLEGRLVHLAGPHGGL